MTDKSIRRALLEEAAQTIDGPRNDTYGGPEASFTEIAKLWGWYMDTPVTATDVAVMMALLKIARIKGSDGKHHDSWVDLAGYAGCGWECVEGAK